MNLKPYFIITFCSTFLSWIIWGLVIYTINPDEAGVFGFILFYTSSCFVLFGTYILLRFVILFLKNKKTEKQLPFIIKSVFQTGLFITLLFLLVLLLLHYNLLTWWNTIVLLILSLILKKTLRSIKVRKNI